MESMGDWLDVIILESYSKNKKNIISEKRLKQIITESIRKVLYKSRRISTCGFNYDLLW